jgi:hypothetical protein
MKSLSPVLASLANAFRIPLRPTSRLVGRDALKVSSQVTAAATPAAGVRPFSSTGTLAKRGGGRGKPDMRVSKLS